MQTTAGVLTAVLLALCLVLLLALTLAVHEAAIVNAQMQSAVEDDYASSHDVDSPPQYLQASVVAEHSIMQAAADVVEPPATYADEEELSAEFCTTNVVRTIKWQPLVTLAALLSMWMATLTVCIRRSLVYAFLRRRSRGVHQVFTSALDGDADDLVAVRSLRALSTQSHRAFVALAGIGSLSPRTVGARVSTREVACAELAMRRAARVKRIELRRRLTSLRSVAVTAVLIGTLGGVLSLMDALTVRVEMDYGIGAVAGVIAESLLLVGMGLLVSITAAWTYRTLDRRVEVLAAEMEATATEVVVRLKLCCRG